jgi:hypothetical protein
MPQYIFAPYDILQVWSPTSAAFVDYMTLRTVEEGQTAERMVMNATAWGVNYRIVSDRKVVKLGDA